jgi:hypothetical protein
MSEVQKRRPPGLEFSIEVVYPGGFNFSQQVRRQAWPRGSVAACLRLRVRAYCRTPKVLAASVPSWPPALFSRPDPQLLSFTSPGKSKFQYSRKGRPACPSGASSMGSLWGLD